MALFHLAFRVDDIETTRAFYEGVLRCKPGRETKRWIDFDFFGHQISAHVAPRPANDLMSVVDGKEIPLVHFGAIVEWPLWERLAERLTQSGHGFVVAPHVRFENEPGEQGTFFVRDPSGNVLEFKSFRDRHNIFATN